MFQGLFRKERQIRLIYFIKVSLAGIASFRIAVVIASFRIAVVIS